MSPVPAIAKLEKRFQRLQDEWQALLEARRLRVADLWDGSLINMRSEHDALLAAGRWTRGPADLFSIVGLSRAEVYHSALIAWLLDPSGRHGFGDRFLTRLLAATNRSETGGINVRSVECEVARSDTRADIVVWADEMTLVVENKVDAPEGIRQCDRLYERFSDELAPSFVFLSPTGRPPRTATRDAAQEFAALSYPALADCLSATLTATADSDADGRPAAVDYLRTLRGQFG